MQQPIQMDKVISKALLFCGIAVLGFSCKTEESQVKTVALQNQEEKESATAIKLRTELDSLCEMNQLAGYGLAVFSSDRVLFENACGFQDIEGKEPYSLNTVQIIASITKSFVGVSLMQAVEDGLLSLDDDINSFIDFEVINPHHPNNPITLRHLATHTSSITDSNEADKGYRFKSPLNSEDFPPAYFDLIPIYNKHEEISLLEFLKSTLHIEGKWYEDTGFSMKTPGAEYEYSNYGLALLACAIEHSRKRPFDSIIQEDILEPLKMINTTWNVAQISEGSKATLYNEWLNRVPDYSIITYPDGGLCSSVSDLMLFLQEIMKCYQGEGMLLSEAACKIMLSKQFNCDACEDGLGWDLSFDGLAGHSGGDFGTATLMYFDLEKDIGRILFTNTSVETEEQENEFYGIFNALFSYDLSQ